MASPLAPQTQRAPRAARPSVVLALSVLGISTAGPLVRLSAASALAIAVWRLAFSLIIVAVMLLASGSWRQWRRLTKRELLVAAAAGAMLAVHFWSWNSSIALTTVAASVVLVNLQPAIVAALSALWLGEAPDRRQVAGIALAMLGALVVALPDLRAQGSGGSRALLGDALAVVGAIAAALYYVSGRRLRRTLDLWAYVGLVYGACFITLLVIAALRRAPLGPQAPRELAIFAALAIGPMMLGHTGMNWALRYLPAYVVNLTTLGEPVGATALAAVIPGIAEVPSIATVAGGAMILGGALITARPSR